MSKSFGPYCSALGCSNARGKDKVSFHIFPTDADLRNRWIDAVQRENFNPSKYAVLCGDHFTQESFVEHVSANPSLGTTKRKLYPNAVPSLFPTLPEGLRAATKAATSETASCLHTDLLHSLRREPLPPKNTIMVYPHSSTSHNDGRKSSVRSVFVEENLRRARKEIKNLRRRCKRLQAKAQVGAGYRKRCEKLEALNVKKQRIVKALRQTIRRRAQGGTGDGDETAHLKRRIAELERTVATLQEKLEKSNQNAFSVMKANSERHYAELSGNPVAMETSEEMGMDPSCPDLKRQTSLEQFGFYQIPVDSKLGFQLTIQPSAE